MQNQSNPLNSLKPVHLLLILALDDLIHDLVELGRPLVDAASGFPTLDPKTGKQLYKPMSAADVRMAYQWAQMRRSAFQLIASNPAWLLNEPGSKPRKKRKGGKNSKKTASKRNDR